MMQDTKKAPAKPAGAIALDSADGIERLLLWLQDHYGFGLKTGNVEIASIAGEAVEISVNTGITVNIFYGGGHHE
jgi:hypothetical protein